MVDPQWAEGFWMGYTVAVVMALIGVVTGVLAAKGVWWWRGRRQQRRLFEKRAERTHRQRIEEAMRKRVETLKPPYKTPD